MAWRLVEVPDGEDPKDLTDDELIGVSVRLGWSDRKVWWKIQEQVKVAFRKERDE